MGEVKRYDLVFGEMAIVDDGEFVDEKDYARLERERDELTTAVEILQCLNRQHEAELTRLRVVEAAAVAYVESIQQCLDPEDPPELLSLAEACGRKG